MLETRKQHSLENDVEKRKRYKERNNTVQMFTQSSMALDKAKNILYISTLTDFNEFTYGKLHQHSIQRL